MLTFIKYDELAIRKFKHILDSISEEDNSIIDELELMAIEEVKSYLSGRFDTDFIFSQKDSKRNPMIKRIVLDYVYCFLFERVSSNEIPDYLVERCDKNRQMLMDIASGKLNPNLQKKDAELESTTGFKFGSETKFIDSNKN
jgi:phage gp36-like protein